MTLPQLITDSATLAALCAQLSGADAISIDTEFIRERTYYPQLCLLQVATHEGAWAIDPLAEGMDLSPLHALLANPAIMKVMHAGRQDMEIFYFAMGRVPAPVFDTQIAALACGYGDSVSYESLVQRVLGKQLDKGARFTDWSRRPLTERQLAYALSDVIYLMQVYEKMRAQMENNGRIAWVEQEMSRLLEPSLYDTPPEDAWKRLKAGNRSSKVLACLRDAAAWREQEARRRDIPRGRIIRDDLLVEIAAAMPQTLEELLHVRGTQQLHKSVQQALVDCVTEALKSPPETYPPSPGRTREENGMHKHALSLLQLLLEVQAAEHKVTPRLIAGRDELEQLANGNQQSPLLEGWRREVFGEAALELLAGKLSIGLDAKGNIHLVR